MDGFGLSANDGIHDDPSVPPSNLRFGVGNLVMYKSEGADGWFEGEVVKVSQRLTLGPRSQYIAYLVWPHREMSDGELGTEWVLEDTDAFIKPRMEDKTPDPSKFKPLLVAPVDPFHFLYTDFKMEDDIEGADGEMLSMAQTLRNVNIDATANPDGSAEIRMEDGRQMKSMVLEIPQEPIYGVDGFVVCMFGSKILSMRRPVFHAPCHDPVKIFKSVIPAGTSLAVLEREAKTSPRKMLLLADCLMLPVQGFPKDARRACNLYRAAAWGCTEEEEPDRVGVPNGIPEAMIAAAMINVSYLERSLGYDMTANVPLKEWLSEGLKTDRGLSCLEQIFYWVTRALRFHGWVTPFTLVLANEVKKMNFVNEPLLVRSDVGEDIRNMCESLNLASEYRKKEMDFKKMQERGDFPRGDPSDEVLRLFGPRAVEIFQSLPLSDEAMHIEFKRVPRAPFPTAIIAFFPSRRRIQKIVQLPSSLQMTPFSADSFEYVWLRVAFDIHLGTLRKKERVRPAKITIPKTHGNEAFASFLEGMLKDTNTKIQLVSHADSVKTGKRSRSTYGELVSEVMALFLDIPGVLIDRDYDSSQDIITRAQEDFVDRMIAQQMSGNDDENDSVHLTGAGQMKARGNQHFQSNEFNAAVRCYSIALGHMRRVVEHDQDSHKLLGTLLSNRAACYLSLMEGQLSLEFQRVLARNAINDCTTALNSSWSSTSLPESILGKLRFRRDKASASYDSLCVEYEPVADILFPAQPARRAEQETAGATDTVVARDAAISQRQAHLESAPKSNGDADEAVIEYGEVLYENELAKNAKDGCPICLRDFNGEIASEYAVVLPCGEHALCASCSCSLKIEADKAKEVPKCVLCRYAFDPEFVEGLPGQIIEKDQEIANLLLQLPDMDLDDKVAAAERLMWTHRFELSAAVDALESILDGKVSGLFFRTEGDLSYQQKEDIYRQARAPVEKVEKQLKLLLQEKSDAVDEKALEQISKQMRQVRSELAGAKAKAREDIYSRMNTVGAMGAEREGEQGSLIQVDYHGLHVSEMRKKFQDHILPILPAVGKVMVITGRGAHSAGKESKLKKALFKLIGLYEKDVYWQKVDKNPGAVYVLWRKTEE